MKKIKIILLIICCFSCAMSEAQIMERPGMKYHRNSRPLRQKRTNRQTVYKFKPSVNLSIGYGFPNVDKDQLVSFQNFYKGNYSQTGPITAAIDYRFSRGMSIGLIAMHGKVSVPYYDYTGAQAIKGSLDNWAFMLNFIRYIPLPNTKILPYIRTAIGINTWTQDYTASGGVKLNSVQKPGDLAYQAGIGATYNFSKHAGVFLEAGYGKYILHGGLTFKF